MSLIARLLEKTAEKTATKDEGGTDDVGAALRSELRQALKGEDDKALDAALRATLSHYTKSDK